jgi:hypothetical protein
MTSSYDPILTPGEAFLRGEATVRDVMSGAVSDLHGPVLSASAMENLRELPSEDAAIISDFLSGRLDTESARKIEGGGLLVAGVTPDYRVVYRSLTAKERKQLGRTGPPSANRDIFVFAVLGKDSSTSSDARILSETLDAGQQQDLPGPAIETGGIGDGDSSVDRRWLRRNLQFVLLALLPVIAATAAAIAAANHGPVRVYWAMLAVVATLCTAALNVVKDRQAATLATHAASARLATASALNVAGAPLVTQLGNVISAKTPKDRQLALDVLISRVVDVAQHVSGQATSTQGNTRCTYYELAGDRLERRYTAGEGSTFARRFFQAGGSSHEDEVIRLARSDSSLLVHDVDHSAPPYFADYRGRSYKSFIAVPVRAGQESLGLLIVDSDQPYSLTDVDRGYMILLAGIIAAGLAHDRASGSFDVTGISTAQLGAKRGRSGDGPKER